MDSLWSSYRYPAIFIIYQTIPLMILAVLVVVGFAARSKLFCSSPSLLLTLLNPTPFCKVTGLAFHYFLVQIPFWWISHVIAVFVNTLFPYQVRRMECSKRLKCLHAFMVAAGLVLPMGSVAGVAVRGGFNLTRLPTYLCVGTDKHVIFALMVVPISVVIALGSTLMVFILWTVIKRHIQAHVHQLRVRLDWTAEAKVFTVLIYYLVLGIMVITVLTFSLLNLQDFFEEANAYFVCESTGIPSNMTEGGSENTTSASCNRENVEDLTDPIYTTVSFVVLGLYPLVYLVYTVNFRELKEKLACTTQREVQMSNKSSWHSNSAHQSTFYPQSINHSYQGADGVYERPSTFTPLS